MLDIQLEPLNSISITRETILIPKKQAFIIFHNLFPYLHDASLQHKIKIIHTFYETQCFKIKFKMYVDVFYTKLNNHRFVKKCLHQSLQSVKFKV